MSKRPDLPEGSRPAGNTLLQAALCPSCRQAVKNTESSITCSNCSRTYPRLGEIPVLLTDPDAYLDSCRQQLELLRHEAEETVRLIENELAAADVLPITRARGQAAIGGILGQLNDVEALVGPLLPAEGGERVGRAPDQRASATLEYLPYLHRDWGASSDVDGENERALSTLEHVRNGRALGRTLILGAGACRLAYDLHHRDPSTEIVALDLDPVLFSAAQAVTCGGAVSICEANWEICEVERSTAERTLTAPDGPVSRDRFHLVIADALDPPFAPQSVDTVVTPWFIDQAPEDIRDLISTLYRLIVPGGLWLNLGPLRYEPEVPIGLRFAREEVFDLAARVGFRMDRWRTDTAPYLVSSLNGRGRIEWVLAFAATKLEAPSIEVPEDGPPAWLIFHHLPIPTFPGQSAFWSETPALEGVVSSIDGNRTLDDIARLVAERMGRSDLSMSQIRGAVRQCLVEVHPEGHSPD